MRTKAVHLLSGSVLLILGFIIPTLLQTASGQSSQVAAEWALFNQILIIGIIVGIVVFGLMFYALIRYREKPEPAGAK